MLIATPASSQTSRNLQATGKVRAGLGPTRDVVVIEGTAQTLDAHDVQSDMGEAFAAATGFDPRTLTRVTIQIYRPTGRPQYATATATCNT